MTELDYFFSELYAQEYVQQHDERGNPIRSFFPKTFSTFDSPLSRFRYLNPRIAAEELYWMINGSGATANDREARVTPGIAKIWQPWAGDMGPMYGVQWRYWQAGEIIVDQLELVTQQLKDTPTTRRAVISAWAAHEVDRMKLPPCPAIWTFSRVGEELSLSVFCRSTDLVCGFPYNSMHSWIFLQIMAREIGAKPASINLSMANPHIYEANWPIAEQWIDFNPPYSTEPYPEIVLSDACTGWRDYTPAHVTAVNNTAPVIHPEVVV